MISMWFVSYYVSCVDARYMYTYKSQSRKCSNVLRMDTRLSELHHVNFVCKS